MTEEQRANAILASILNESKFGYIDNMNENTSEHLENADNKNK